ncbi:CU044_2847 family protein [Streptomyces sp. NPDC001920]
MPETLQGALEPVTRAAQATLDQLRKARPDQITLEFGVDLAFEAGAVITKSQASCHLKVTVRRAAGATRCARPGSPHRPRPRGTSVSRSAATCCPAPTAGARTFS